MIREINMKIKDIILVGLVAANLALAAAAGALALARAERPALAGAESRAGDYVMVTGHVTSSREALLVIDTVAQRANLYVPKAAASATGTKWELVATRNLAADFHGK
jgi:hypothetical protein